MAFVIMLVCAPLGSAGVSDLIPRKKSAEDFCKVPLLPSLHDVFCAVQQKRAKTCTDTPTGTDTYTDTGTDLQGSLQAAQIWNIQQREADRRHREYEEENSNLG